MIRNDLDQSALHPWPVVRGLLLTLSSYEVPEVVDRTGLVIDWTLTEREDHTQKMRLAAYRPRIDAAFRALATDDDRLRVAYILSRELAKHGLENDLLTALREIGWEFRNDRLVPCDSDVRELFFPQLSHHDAYVEIRAILQKAITRVIIIDPYVDQSLLTLLSTCAKPGLNVQVLTAKCPVDLVLEAKKWRIQHSSSSLDIRTTREFHDRFVVLDDSACWHIGCSIKDAGSKAFMLSELEDHDNRVALLAQASKSWNGGAAAI